MKTQSLVEDTVLPERREDRVGWAYKVAAEAARAKARFDAWAKSYEKDVEDLWGWRGPEATLTHVLTYVDKDQKILDAGAGTGLMGKLLRENGYHDLIGTDISIEMLKVAREKEIYNSDFEADLTKALPLEDESFDSVISVGVSGYMIPNTLKELHRVIKPGGTLIYTISDDHFYKNGFETMKDELVDAGKLIVEEISAEFATIPKSEPQHLARVHVYRKIG